MSGAKNETAQLREELAQVKNNNLRKDISIEKEKGNRKDISLNVEQRKTEAENYRLTAATTEVGIAQDKSQALEGLRQLKQALYVEEANALIGRTQETKARNSLLASETKALLGADINFS